jgi:hypothetical protein
LQTAGNTVFPLARALLKDRLIMKNSGQHSLVEPFDIDNGSLRAVNQEYAFALGVEWQLFRQQLLDGKPFKTLCLPENRDRLVALAERHRRFVEDRQTACVGWREIWVGDLIACEPPESKPS